MRCCSMYVFFFFKQKTAYEMRISDWSSDVCSSDLLAQHVAQVALLGHRPVAGLFDQVMRRQPADFGAQRHHHALGHDQAAGFVEIRSEERRVGKECVSTCRSRWSPDT